ncbi:MAG: GntR family transcriptional regulator [Devosia sp.]|jgi:DNA-binding GntR family transcriptional regulator
MSGKAVAPARPVRGAGVQTVYEQLRLAIVNLDLPPGSPLDEVRLSQQFALSRTPVREALVRLAGDGLVTTLPNRSTVVAPIDFERLPVYFEALTLMYRVTTRAAAQRRMPRHIAAMRQAQAQYVEAVARNDAVSMISTNRDFHLAIAEAGGNSYFTSWFSRLLDEGRRLLRLYYYAAFDDHLPRKYVDEHEAIIRAIEKGDADRADELAALHAAQIVRQIQSYIARDVTATMRLSDKPARRSRSARAS